MSTNNKSLIRFIFGLLTLATYPGCDNPAPIETYTVPTEIPEQLRVGNERMLAAMLPHGQQVWFFKVTGPEDAIGSIESTFRDFVQQVRFDDGGPVLEDLPESWKIGGEKPMRFATIDVNTPGKQLDISVSSLGRQQDWDEMVKMNVNRWRGQLGLSPSQEKWAEGKSLEVASADGDSVWVDLVGRPGSGSMTSSMESSMESSMAGGAGFGSDMMPVGDGSPPAKGTSPSSSTDSRLEFDQPEGWREGRMSSMRMAAFNVGPEDAQAELTVIPAGGDLRGNVARWLGQVRSEKVPDSVVDDALSGAMQVDVDGRKGQRFLLLSEDSDAGNAIDATIVPLDGGMSLFIKMTGPVETVTQQSDAIASFLDSLRLNL